MQNLGSNCKENVTDSLSFFPVFFFVVVLGQWYIHVCAFFLPHMHNTCGSWESGRRWFFLFPLCFSYYLFYPPRPFLLKVQGNERRNLTRFMLFLSCTAVCVIGYYNWVCFYCPLTKVPSYFWFPGFSDRRTITCIWSVSASATYRLWVAVGLTSCSLFFGVTASVTLRNRKGNGFSTG